MRSERLGFAAINCRDFARKTLDELINRMRDRPGTGTPEAGGMSSRELLEVLRGLEGLNVAGADIVEVAHAYDHAEITGSRPQWPELFASV